MRNRRKHHPARQLPPRELGLPKWQRDFWLTLLVHALADNLGPPDLMKNDGFENPAVIRYAVTTPDLLHSFRRYNDGKPYHRQVRPFGFMVMFQQADEADPSTVMRVIAPFNRNPTKAARRAFDRDTGGAVSPKRLKTYTAALRTYHNHPEAKFRNGERGDRGPTKRRNVICKSIVHIGKEANGLDIQAAFGVDPAAQIEYDVDAAKAVRLKAVAEAVRRFGSSRIAREAGLSRKHISSIAGGRAVPTNTTLSYIERVIPSLEIEEAKRSVETARVLSSLQAACEQAGLRKVAAALDISPSTLSRIVKGKRQVSINLMRSIDLAIAVAG